MPVPDRPASGPLIRTPWKAVAAQVRAALASGDLAPEERLPSLDAMAARWSVNRKTVRKAYVALAAEGLIEPVPGLGYFACRPPDSLP